MKMVLFCSSWLFAFIFTVFYTLHGLIVVMLAIQFGADILTASIPGGAIGKHGTPSPGVSLRFVRFCSVAGSPSRLTHRPCEGSRRQVLRGADTMPAPVRGEDPSVLSSVQERREKGLAVHCPPRSGSTSIASLACTLGCRRQGTHAEFRAGRGLGHRDAQVSLQTASSLVLSVCPSCPGQPGTCHS